MAVAVPGCTFRHFLLGAAEMVLILTKHPDADLTPFRSTYLAHLRQRAEAYRDPSRRLFGRDIHQVMLLHHNLINALFLDDAIQLFKGMGWTITDPATAYQDFVYSLDLKRKGALPASFE